MPAESRGRRLRAWSARCHRRCLAGPRSRRSDRRPAGMTTSECIAALGDACGGCRDREMPPAPWSMSAPVGGRARRWPWVASGRRHVGWCRGCPAWCRSSVVIPNVFRRPTSLPLEHKIRPATWPPRCADVNRSDPRHRRVLRAPVRARLLRTPRMSVSLRRSAHLAAPRVLGQGRQPLELRDQPDRRWALRARLRPCVRHRRRGRRRESVRRSWRLESSSSPWWEGGSGASHATSHHAVEELRDLRSGASEPVENVTRQSAPLPLIWPCSPPVTLKSLVRPGGPTAQPDVVRCRFWPDR